MIQKQTLKETEIGMIPEGWSEIRLSDIIEIIGGGTPKTTVSEYWNGDIPWLSVVDFNNDLRKVYTTEKTITEEGLKNSSTRILKKGEIIISARGTVGVLAQLGRDMAFNQSCYGLRAKQNTTNDFVYYLLKQAVNKLKISAHGSVFDTITRDTFDLIDVLFPPISEQKLITKILGALDDKISLNRSMNATLEAIGQALFKRWFIDFEFQDGEGKPYRSSGGEMVETELGEVPRGWRVGSILDCADLLSGGTPKTEMPEYWSGDIPWVSAKDVTVAHGSFVLDTERKITQAGIDNSNAKLLPKNTTVVTARGTVGSYCILSREIAINQTNYGLKAKSGTGDFFIFFLISNLVNQMKQNAYGTIFDTITTKTFKEMKISIPPETLIKSFDYNVNGIMSKMLSNLQESRTLTALRDALLPKLMSGEVRVGVNDF